MSYYCSIYILSLFLSVCLSVPFFDLNMLLIPSGVPSFFLNVCCDMFILLVFVVSDICQRFMPNDSYNA